MPGRCFLSSLFQREARLRPREQRRGGQQQLVQPEASQAQRDELQLKFKQQQSNNNYNNNSWGRQQWSERGWRRRQQQHLRGPRLRQGRLGLRDDVVHAGIHGVRHDGLQPRLREVDDHLPRQLLVI